jgi:hypothetical protein
LPKSEYQSTPRASKRKVKKKVAKVKLRAHGFSFKKRSGVYHFPLSDSSGKIRRWSGVGEMVVGRWYNLWKIIDVKKEGNNQ